MGDERLIKASKHIAYELNQLRYSINRAVQLYPLIQAGKEIGGELNSHVESFATHIRNLLHFLLDGKAKKDYVIAEHFLEDETLPVWEKYVVKKNFQKGEVFKKTDNQLSHITYARAEYDDSKDKGWNPKLASDVEEMCFVLFDLVKNDKLHEDLIQWRDIQKSQIKGGG